MSELLLSPAEARVLEDLNDRAQPLVKLLPRAAGQSTARYAHLLCGEAEIEAAATTSERSESSSLASRVATLEARVAELERRLGDA